MSFSQHIIILQTPLLDDFFKRLHLIPDFEIRPVFETHAAFVSLSRFRDVLFDVFEGGEGSWFKLVDRNGKKEGVGD